jgi:hypothetical protein
MNEQLDQPTELGDGWPMPSPDVLREIEPPALAPVEEWPVSSPPMRHPARG